MTAVLLPEGKQSFTDAAGVPLVGGKLWTTVSGTGAGPAGVPLTTWVDPAEVAPNTNPIILDGRGECVVYWRGVYTVQLRDALDNVIWTLTTVTSAFADTQLRADLASTTVGSDGALIVGYRRLEAGSLAETVAAVLRRTIFVADFVTNTTPGTTDLTAGITAAIAAAAAQGGGTVILPPQRIKTTSEIVRPAGVSLQGAGRNTTIIEAAHNGIIISQVNPAVVAVVDDQFAFIDGIGFKASGASTPSHAIKYRNVGFTRISNCRYAGGIVIGEYLEFVLDSRFDNINNSADTGTKIVSTSTANGTNLNKFTTYAWASNATLGLSIDGHGSYNNVFDTCQWFSQPTLAIDHVYGSGTQFINPSFEGNAANTVKLRGGDGIRFKFGNQIDPFNLIDVASFGARNVTIEDSLGWVQTVQPPWPANDEISVRDPIYTLDEAAGPGSTDEAHYITEGHHTTGRQFANFPGYASGQAFYADSHITPYGGVIPSGAYNRIGSFDFTDGAQWSTVGTGGATDPFGGATAYNVNTIASTQNGGNLLGAAATGRTFTFQVWAKFLGRVRLGIGTTALGIRKFANLYSTNASTWRLLSVTYTSGVDAGTTPLCNILTSQATVMWQPCHYEAFGPLPALAANRNLAGILFPMTVKNLKVTVRVSAVPAAGAWAVGDAAEQTVPVVGNPKGWRCTVAGSPGTWVSEGNL